MLLSVPGTGVEKTTDATPAWDDVSETGTERLSEDGQEHDGDVDDLGLEVHDLLEDTTKGRQSNAYHPSAYYITKVGSQLTNDKHANGPWVHSRVIIDLNDMCDDIFSSLKRLLHLIRRHDLNIMNILVILRKTPLLISRIDIRLGRRALRFGLLLRDAHCSLTKKLKHKHREERMSMKPKSWQGDATCFVLNI